MDVQPPVLVRRSSVLFGVCAVAATILGAAAIACWVRVGAVADAYHTLAWTDQEFRSLDQDADGLRFGLAFNMVVGPVTAVVTAVLTFALRRPWPWARMTAFWFAGLAVMLLIVGVASIAMDSSGGDSPIPDLASVADAHRDLGTYPLAEWYGYLSVQLDLLLIGALIAAATHLSGLSVTDFYRAESRQEDPRWTSFVQLRKERQERGI
ncbi:hypothetical protein [Actinoplanes regularis]|uniref:hypothetical protein n=1 Tax=Actinoplanes regularis TaxID=52697 RepID=UPI002555B033|nr:hypothetical protein [Actinoplanes regularis]